MHVRRSPWGVEVVTPAKLNLFLEVLARRNDGFHEIETLMAPVGLWDGLLFQSRPELAIELTVAGAASSDLSGAALPTDRKNLAVRATELMRERAGIEAGAQLRLVKCIPLEAGMAGGSSDAAAALVAANIGWNIHWPTERLAALAAELGSDVPFFLQRGAAICRGRGERIEPVSGLAGLHFVVVRPPVGLSTADVYRGCQPSDRPRSAAPLIDALRAGRLARAGELLHNGLQAAAARLTPWIERLRVEFARLDVWGHQMSGSGTSYFGICRHARQARQLASLLATRGVGQTYALAGLG